MVGPSRAAGWGAAMTTLSMLKSVRRSAVLVVVAAGLTVPTAFDAAAAATPPVLVQVGDTYNSLYYDAYTGGGENQHFDDAEGQTFSYTKSIAGNAPTSSWGSARASASTTHTVTRGAGNSTDGWQLKQVTMTGTTTGRSQLTDELNQQGTPGAYSEVDFTIDFETTKYVEFALSPSHTVSSSDADNCSYIEITLVGDPAPVDVSRYWQAGGGCNAATPPRGALNGMLPPGLYELEVDVYVDVDSETGSAQSSATGGATLTFGHAADCDNPLPTTGDVITGTSGDDVLCGGPGADDIDGLGGEDTIFGNAGSDTIGGGTGADVVYGGFGNDTIDGNEAFDTIVAGDGNDTVDGGGGGDVINAGPGDDTVGGGDGHDTATGGAGHDDMFGGLGDDEINGGPDGDVLDGGDGQDKILGDDGDDVITGGAQHDVLKGGSGRDTVDGEGGPDHLLGGGQRDHLSGGPGDDVVEGDGGNDDLSGGDGINELRGDAGDDTLHGGRLIDLLKGGGGDDTLIGAGDADSFSGDGGNDVLKMCDNIEDLDGDGGDGHDTAYRDPQDPLASIEVEHAC
jgi:hypothetical protein